MLLLVSGLDSLSALLLNTTQAMHTGEETIVAQC